MSNGRRSVSMHRDAMGRDWINATVSKWGAYIAVAVHLTLLIAALATLVLLWLRPEMETAADEKIAPVARRVTALEGWRAQHGLSSAAQLSEIKTEIKNNAENRAEDNARLERWLERIEQKIDRRSGG